MLLISLIILYFSSIVKTVHFRLLIIAILFFASDLIDMIMFNWPNTRKYLLHLNTLYVLM